MATQTRTISNIDEALAAVGVTYNTLSKQEKQSLDEQGYIVLPKVAEGKWLQQLRDGFEAVERVEPSKGGTRHPANLITQGPAYERVVTNPRLLAAIHHILKDDFRLTTLAGRDPLPGNGQQGLHADWGGGLNDPKVNVVATALWMLDDFTTDNGATRVVTGSHLYWQNLPKAMAQPLAIHPQQITVQGKAGSILVFNGYLWHSGQRNNSQLSRRALQITFSLRAYQRLDPLPPTNYDGLGAVAKYILG